MSVSGSQRRQIPILEELREAIRIRLPDYLARQRWFSGKARQIRSSELVDIVHFHPTQTEAFFLLARVEYASGPGETYVLPLLCLRGVPKAEPAERAHAFLNVENADAGLRLIDALENHDFLAALLQAIEEASTFQGWKGEIHASHTRELESLLPSSGGSITAKLLKGEQSNSSVVFGENLILKIFRRTDAGMNPDLEMGLFLTEKAHFENIPPVAGSLEYRAENGQTATLGFLQGFVPNQGDAWRFTLRRLAAFWQEVSAAAAEPPRVSIKLDSLIAPPNQSTRSLDSYLDAAGLLAKRTAQMHQALSSDPSDPAFAPETFSIAFQQSLGKSIRELAERNLGLLRQKKQELPPEVRSHAEEVISRETEILERIRSTLGSPITSTRIRIHGDYHLGQALYTGSDFMIIDFEGEPAQSLEDRRVKRSPLRDVAGMLRSFHYAAFASWMTPPPGSERPEGDPENLMLWAQAWTGWVSSRFLNAYLEQSPEAPYLPQDRKSMIDLLELHILEKAIYELGYELNNRPAWVGIPLAGISAILDS